MKSPRPEKDWKKKKKKIEDNIIKDVRNLFTLQNEIDDTAIKDIKNIFRLKKENDAIKGGIIRDIRNLFEYEEGDYDKPVRIGKLLNNNYIEYESSSARNTTVSIEEYLSKVRPKKRK